MRRSIFGHLEGSHIVGGLDLSSTPGGHRGLFQKDEFWLNLRKKSLIVRAAVGGWQPLREEMRSSALEVTVGHMATGTLVGGLNPFNVQSLRFCA